MLRGVSLGIFGFLLCLHPACGSPTATSGAAAPTTAVAATPGAAQARALDPPRPTLRLPRNFVPAAYRVRLAIDPAAERFRGSIEIDGDVRERSSRIWLHGRGLAITAASIAHPGGRQRVEVAAVGEDLLSLQPAAPLDPGRYTIAIDYDAAFDVAEPFGVYRQTFDDNRYVVTQFEAIYARRAFPCFDEPDNKVSWQLTLDVPRALVAVANTPVASETLLDTATRRVVFAPTKPLPSYLVAFAVGPYDVIDLGTTRSGAPMRIFALKGRAAEARYVAETTPRIVQLLEDYFGGPYPYEKLDQLALPAQIGGAMENPGLIVYAKGLMLHDPAQISHRQRATWVYFATHEVAHQWFGNVVTPAWWNDIWLNEGLADWLGAKILAELEPAWRGELIDNDERNFALGADSAVTARRVRQPIATVADIFQAFDGITYNKGESILAMFERVVGPERFRDGVRAYIAEHRHGNATSADFLAAISKVAGRDLAPAMGTFLDQAGAPVVRSELRCERGQPARLQLAQRRYVLPGAPPTPEAAPWQLPVCIAYDVRGARRDTCVELTTPTAEIALDTSECPSWVFANAGGRGYYRTSQRDSALTALRDHGWKQLTAVERMAAFNDAAALAVAGELDVGIMMSFVPRLMAEKHRFAVEAAVNSAARARRWIDPAKLPVVDAWIRATFGPAARALSWQPRPHDDIDAEAQRIDLVSLVAWSGDPVLRAEAVKLAASWRALSPAYRSSVLAVAVDAHRGTFDRALAAVPVEKDPELRVDLLRALVQVSDESRLRSVVALTWDKRLDPLEVRRLLFAGRSFALRSTVEAYFRERLEQLLERFPDNGHTGTASLAYAFLGSCDAARRDDIAGFVKQRFGAYVGAERVLAQGLEGLDTCIALRKLLAPRFAAWLAKR